MTIQLIKEFEEKFKSNKKYDFNVGDTIRVHTKIIEGEKERIQVFAGIVIAISGKGLSKTFTIYRNAYGCSMERIFLLNSPRITKIEIEKKGKVKRSKLYYLRGVSGKKAKIKEQILRKEKKSKEILEDAIVAEKITDEKVELNKEIKTEKTPEKPKKKSTTQKVKKAKPEKK